MSESKAKGVRVGKYILKETLGTGFFAEVKLAIHTETGEKYAIKIIDKRKVPLKDLERQIKREVKIMQYLRHDFIVSVHQVLMSGTRMYLVMDYVSGGELFDLIVKRHRINEEDSRKYFQQLVDAVSYCHDKGVYHRDLKPENLLLDENGDLKITDFGMSFLTDNATNAADTLLFTHCGTPEYMAPELASRSHKGYRGDKLDVWSCGVILFVLLAGGLPFSGKSDGEIFRQIMKKKLIYPSWFSPEVSSLLDIMLIKDPQERASLEDVKQHPWFRVGYVEHPRKSGFIKMPSPVDDKNDGDEETESERPPGGDPYLMDIMSPTGAMSPREGSVTDQTPSPAAITAALKKSGSQKSPDSVLEEDDLSFAPQNENVWDTDTKQAVNSWFEDAPQSVRTWRGFSPTRKKNPPIGMGEDASGSGPSRKPPKLEEGSFRVRVPSFLTTPRLQPHGVPPSGPPTSASGDHGPSSPMDNRESAIKANKNLVHAELKSTYQHTAEDETAVADEMAAAASKRRIHKEMAKIFNRKRETA